MMCVSLPGFGNQQMMITGGIDASCVAMPSLGTFCRYAFDCIHGCWSDCGKGKFNYMTAKTARNATVKKMNTSVSHLASCTLAVSALSYNSSRANLYKEILEAARDKFTREICLQSKDKDISLAKALLYVAVEDEALLAFNREIDAHSVLNERREMTSPCNVQSWNCVESMPIAGKNVNGWLTELDVISREVEAELVSREIGFDSVEVLGAVNKVLFELRGFRRSPVLVDSKCSYLHTVLSSGCASAILLSVIYIEVCRRLNLTIVGSRVGEDFLIWPATKNPEELFRTTSGHSLFGIVNGKCVEDPRSKASDISSNSLLGLDIATNRDIIGISLANLIRLYWKRASKLNYGLMLTSPLRPFHKSEDKFNNVWGSNVPLLRPQELRLRCIYHKIGLRMRIL
ncbi:uncharacterized protein LOC142555594 isoform X2 [Primulina tabacum]|uniref:uncharacterized protein LOC142555594 isoform X2 n=1 Tax=Primulina tabacum TaxID=48773 RepID=UPI003F5957B5